MSSIFASVLKGFCSCVPGGEHVLSVDETWHRQMEAEKLGFTK